jgi:curli biogenesis system outer membrane secretion channel CsgG
MSGITRAIFGGGNSAAQGQQALMQLLAQQALTTSAAQITQQQGEQLALQAKSQGEEDQTTAILNKPGRGRALLTYNDRTGGAATLGG